MAALGETFRTARESQGLSLSDVADRIHIRSAYLAAIEAEDWAAIGPVVYVRGFLRSYARFLGLDADAAVAGFGASAGGAVPAVRSEPSRSGLRGEEPTRPVIAREPARPARGLSGWALAGVVVAIALVAFVAYQYSTFRAAGGRPAARPAESMAVAPAAGAPTPRRAAEPESGAATKNVAKSSTFAVRLKDSSWLRVTVDGKVAMEGLYAAGTSRAFSGRSVTVRVGNAGGVDVSVDGKDLGPLGGLGDVAERSFQL